MLVLGGFVITGTILLVLAIVILVMAAFWYYLKFLKVDDLADSVEKSGGKILDIFGKILFYSIVVIIFIVIANIL